MNLSEHQMVVAGLVLGLLAFLLEGSFVIHAAWKTPRVQRLLAKRSEKARANRLKILLKGKEGLADIEMIGEVEDYILDSIITLSAFLILNTFFVLVGGLTMWGLFTKFDPKTAFNLGLIMVIVYCGIILVYAGRMFASVDKYRRRVSPLLRNQADREIKELTDLAKEEELRK
jgi:hypothetical protein